MLRKAPTVSHEVVIAKSRAEVFAQAWKSYLGGNFPAGAVVLNQEGDFVSGGGNRARSIGSSDQSNEIRGSRIAHAEINALYALRHLDEPLSGHTVVCSHEPCPMCMGAMHNFRVGSIYFYARDPHSQRSNLDDTRSRFAERGGVIACLESPADEAVFVALQVEYFLRNSLLRPEKHQLLSSSSLAGVGLGSQLYRERFYSRLARSTSTDQCLAALLGRSAEAVRSNGPHDLTSPSETCQ